MKQNSLKNKLLAFTFTGIAALFTLQISRSAYAENELFGETPLDPTKVIAIASPYGENKYNLLIVEQLKQKKQCWEATGDSPIAVDPLLLKFDFTGICGRATDSNGYSIRLEGKDYGLDVLLSVVSRDNDLLLIGTNRTTGEEIIVGRTKGLQAGFLKIQLEPGWHFTKRIFSGQKLGHFYFSKNSDPNLYVVKPSLTTADLSTTDHIIKKSNTNKKKIVKTVKQ